MPERPAGWLAGAGALAALALAGSACGGSGDAGPQTLRELLRNNNVPAHHRSLYFVVNHRKLPWSAFRDIGITARPQRLVGGAASQRVVTVCHGGRAGTTVADSLQCSNGIGVDAIPAGVRVYEIRPQPGAPRVMGPEARPVGITPRSTVVYFADPKIRLAVELGGAGWGYAMDDRAVR